MATTVAFFFAGLFEHGVAAAVAVAAGALDFTGCPRHITGSTNGGLHVLFDDDFDGVVSPTADINQYNARQTRPVTYISVPSNTFPF